MRAPSVRKRSWVRRERIPARTHRLVNWYRADQGITIATGVSQWNDLSGNGRHLVQATTTKQPPFSASGGANNQPYVGTFDRVDDFLRVTYAQSQPEHVFCVALASFSDQISGDIFDGSAGNTRRLLIAAIDQIGIFGGTAVVSDFPVDVAIWRRFNCEFNGASSAITVDSRTRQTGDAGSASSGGLIVGMFGDQVSNPNDCRIGEVYVFQKILNTTEIHAQNAYLAGRYRI